MSAPIYLDYLATTPICKEASAAMVQLLSEDISPEGCWGNPGSTHHVYGKVAKQRLEDARNKVATLLNCESSEICFESGSTETINHAIKGILQGNSRKHIVLSEIEHPAVYETAQVAADGNVTVVSPNHYGIVEPQMVADACRPGETALVTIMLVNNEVGSVMDWRAISRAVKAVDPEIILHCDASQAVGKIEVDVKELNIDLLTVAGHKFYAPKGVGALYIRKGVDIKPLINGAGHESGNRAGTENILLATALAAACEAAQKECLTKIEDTRAFRETLFKSIREHVAPISVLRNGPVAESQRLPGALSISFPGMMGSDIAAKAGEK
jgi:cysteine desulfurase